MKIMWINPDKDEILTFDLPDGAQQMQVGALCSCRDDRRLVNVSLVNRHFACSSDRLRGQFTTHWDWPLISYRFVERDSGVVALVYEGDAEPFAVYPEAK